MGPAAYRQYRWTDMHLVGKVCSLLLLGMIAEAWAQPPDPEEIRTPRMIVLATTSDAASGREEANRAGDRLGYALAPDTLRKPTLRRVYVGAVITLQRLPDDRFVVASYLGDEQDAKEALAKAKKYYPSARMVPVSLPGESTDEWIDAPFFRLGILVVGSYRSYDAALRAAEKFSVASGYSYGSRGMVYDKERGLIWPDDSKDEVWAGQYAPRRYDNECNILKPNPCVTVERSEGYEGFTPGLYIVVAGVLDRDDKEKRLANARRSVPSAYIKQTTLYLGCVH